MYGVMALLRFGVLKHGCGHIAAVDNLRSGSRAVGHARRFATAYPVNWWLIRRGLKEAM